MSDKVRRVDYYPDEFLVGTVGMDNEMVGAYWRICTLIYSNGGPIEDDPGRICHHMKCTRKTWQRVRDALLACGKLFMDGDRISNKRTVAELSQARARILVARSNGGRSGGRPRKKPPETANINDLEKPGGYFSEKLTTNHQPPVLSTIETNVSMAAESGPVGHEAIDLKRQIWDVGKRFLCGPGGMTRDSAGRVIGMWRRDHGDAAVLNAIAAAEAEAASEPVGFITKILQRDKERFNGTPVQAEPERSQGAAARILARRAAEARNGVG